MCARQLLRSGLNEMSVKQLGGFPFYVTSIASVI